MFKKGSLQVFKDKSLNELMMEEKSKDIFGNLFEMKFKRKSRRKHFIILIDYGAVHDLRKE